ncbi:15028_t:CDS:10 [Entrophospora sp. SA101]|nr:15028_t:CDS:10 [Entrophospora sp. SA101]
MHKQDMFYVQKAILIETKSISKIDAQPISQLDRNEQTDKLIATDVVLQQAQKDLQSKNNNNSNNNVNNNSNNTGHNLISPRDDSEKIKGSTLEPKDPLPLAVRKTFFGSMFGSKDDKKKYQDPKPDSNKVVFGVSLDQAIAVSRIKENYELPAVVYRCIEYLDANNAAEEEGIYRLNGATATIKRLKERFNTEGDVDLLSEEEYYDVHAVAGLLKLYLRELPTSVLSRDLHLEFVNVIDLLGRKDRINELGRLVSALPLSNYTLLRTLTGHLIRIVQNAQINKMTARNIGIVFSPTLGIPASVFSLFMAEFDYIFFTNSDGVAAPRTMDASSEEPDVSKNSPVALLPVTAVRRIDIRDELTGRNNRNSVHYMDSAPEKVVGLEKRMTDETTTQSVPTSPRLHTTQLPTMNSIPTSNVKSRFLKESISKIDAQPISQLDRNEQTDKLIATDVVLQQAQKDLQSKNNNNSNNNVNNNSNNTGHNLISPRDDSEKIKGSTLEPKDPLPLGNSTTHLHKQLSLRRDRHNDEHKKAVRKTFFGSMFGSKDDKKKYQDPKPDSNKVVFGVSLDQAIAVSRIKENYELPAVVYRCIEYLDANNAAEEEGIYRLNGATATIKRLKERFNTEGDVDLLSEEEYYDVHAVAGLLKLYLRELPTSVLSRDLHLEFVNVIDLLGRKDRINELGRLVSALPLSNYTLLRTLTGHLIRIVQNAQINKMTARNIGIVFSPTLAPRTMDASSEEPDVSKNSPVALLPVTAVRRIDIRDELTGRNNRNSVHYMDSAPEKVVGLEKRMTDETTTQSVPTSPRLHTTQLPTMNSIPTSSDLTKSNDTMDSMPGVFSEHQKQDYENENISLPTQGKSPRLETEQGKLAALSGYEVARLSDESLRVAKNLFGKSISNKFQAVMNKSLNEKIIEEIDSKESRFM